MKSGTFGEGADKCFRIRQAHAQLSPTGKFKVISAEALHQDFRQPSECVGSNYMISCAIYVDAEISTLGGILNAVT